MSWWLSEEKNVFYLEKNKWKIFFGVTIIGFFLDWLTKYLAVVKLQMGVPFPVIGKVLQWQLIYNTGGLFGFNPKSWIPGFPTNLFYYIMSTIAMIIIVIYYSKIDVKAKFSYWGISLIMPGALGNIFDRIIRPGKGVVDFIRVDLNFPPFNPWPIWNLADAYITIGVALIIIDLWFQEKEKKPVEEEDS